MNTLSHAVTLFTEHSSSISGPVHPGPTLYEWSAIARHALAPSGETQKLVALIPVAHQKVAQQFPSHHSRLEPYLPELARTTPDSHPSRALYGEYLSWCAKRAIATLPPWVTVIHHAEQAIGITRHRNHDGTHSDRITLHSGLTLNAHATILTTGWISRTPPKTEQAFVAQLASRPELQWVAPAHPIEQDLSKIRGRSTVIVRGLGMSFFDTMALCTIERGGQFNNDPDTRSGLTYLASGNEPIMHVTSHSEIPFRAKSTYAPSHTQHLPP